MENNRVFPTWSNQDVNKENIQNQVYGLRLYRDQTFFEYLLEFLLVFVSPKGTTKENLDTGFSFPTQYANGKIFYRPMPRMGLKRFIFLSRSEQEKRFQVDIDALEDHRTQLKNKITITEENYDKDFVIDILQDLLYGFNAVIGKRSWFAQSLLPISSELIFCEAIGSKKVRSNMEYDKDTIDTNERKNVDFGFQFNQKSFMARGGEVYYLHVLQGLTKQGEIKEEVEDLLKNLVNGVPQLSEIAKFIQGTWEEYHVKHDNKDLSIKKEMEWIPNNYEGRSVYTVREMKNLLSSLINPLEKIELLGSLIIMQIMRMMCLQASLRIDKVDNLEWVIDLTQGSNEQVRKIAVNSYLKVEEYVFRAVHTANLESYKKKLEEKNNQREDTDIYEDASKDTNRLIRRIGKYISLIVPPKGASMRFSLNENLIKLLVVTIIEPGERMLLTTFLSKCYEHYKMIIGPIEAKMHFHDQMEFDVSCFNENLEQFQQMLKDSGFLRDLSDATSIVENPFKG